MPDNEKFQTVLDALRTLRRIDEEMPAQQVMTLLFVSMHPDGVGMKDIAEKVGLSQSATSRNVSILGPEGYMQKPGLKLVDRHDHPSDSRQRIVRLTAKGERVIEELRKEMR
jgi:DNA-binding MarR family transcriptional regulator